MTRRILALLFAFALLGAACSDDDNSGKSAAKSVHKTKATTTTVKQVKPKDNTHGVADAGGGSTTTVPVKVADTFTGGDKKAYCAAWSDLKGYYFFPPSTPDDIRKVYRKYGEISARLVAAGPKEIKDELQEAQDVNDEIVRTGSTYPLDRRETKRAAGVIQTYSEKQCA